MYGQKWGGPIAVDGSQWWITPRTVRLNLAGEVLQDLESRVYWVPTPFPPRRSDPRPGHGQVTHIAAPGPVTAASSVTWPAAEYQLTNLRFYHPVPSPDSQKPTWRFWREVGPGSEYIAKSQPTFDAKRGEATAWTIELPKEWLDKVHKEVPVQVAFRFLGAPEWLESDSIVESDIYVEGDLPVRPGEGLPTARMQAKLTGEIVPELQTQSYESQRSGYGGGADLVSTGPLRADPTLTMSPQRYRLVALRLWRPIPSRDPENTKALYWRLTGKSHTFPPVQRPEFQPETGRPNVWTIELPADWLEQVRAAGIPGTRPAASRPARPGVPPMPPVRRPAKPKTQPARAPDLEPAIENSTTDPSSAFTSPGTSSGTGSFPGR